MSGLRFAALAVDAVTFSEQLPLNNGKTISGLLVFLYSFCSSFPCFSFLPLIQYKWAEWDHFFLQVNIV